MSLNGRAGFGVIVVMALCGMLFPGSALARNSVGATYTGARDYNGIQLDGAFDLDADKKWKGSGLFGHVHSTISGLESSTNQLILGASHFPDEENDVRGALTLWTDTVNKIHYAGPSAGYTRTWLDPATDEETFGLSIDADLFFYGADVDMTTQGKTVRRGTQAVVTRAATVTTTQFHPYLSLEKPFLEERIIPFLIAGHYFYSTDPNAIEAAVNKLGIRFGSTAGITAMTGGFISNNISVGSIFWLASATRLRVELGRDQSATDSTWSTVYNVKIDQTFAGRWRIALGWSHSVQQDVPIDYGIAGLTYLF